MTSRRLVKCLTLECGHHTPSKIYQRHGKASQKTVFINTPTRTSHIANGSKDFHATRTHQYSLCKTQVHRIGHHHHHHHISFMELGHLLTRSCLTYPEVSSKVYHDSIDPTFHRPYVALQTLKCAKFQYRTSG